MATSAVSSTTSASTAAATLSANSASSATSAQAASKAAAQKIVTSLGSGSGVDVNSLAQNLVDAERIPRQTAIQNKIDKNTARVSGLSAMYYMLSDLKAKLSAMKDKSGLSSLTATSSSSAISATAAPGAVVGSHEIHVNKLATAQRFKSSGFASESTSINNGNPFQVTISKPGVVTSTGTSATSSAVNGQVASLSGLSPNGFFDYSEFSIVIDGNTTLTVSPQLGLNSLADLAADLQSKLQADPAGGSITVSVDPTVPDQLNIDAGPTHSVSLPAFKHFPLHVDGISFGSPTALAGDFTNFSVDLDGQPTSVALPPVGVNPADPADPAVLAQSIEDQLPRGTGGLQRYFVSAVGTASDFRLYLKDSEGGTVENAVLTPDATAVGVSIGMSSDVGQASLGSQRVASVSGIGLGGGSDFSNFSIMVDPPGAVGPTVVQVTPSKGLTSLADLASDLQTKLRTESGLNDFTVTLDATNSNQLNFTSASAEAVYGAAFTAAESGVHLDGIKFGTTPAADDFKSFSVVINGVTRSFSLGPTAATASALATNIQTEIQTTDADVTVEAVSNAGNFSLYFKSSVGKTFASPQLLTNVVDMTPPVGLSGGTASAVAAGVKTGSSSGATLSGISLGSTPLVSNFKSFTVTIDGAVKTVSINPIDPTASTLPNLATEVQRQLRLLIGTDDISVSASGTSSLSVSSASGKTVSAPMLSATTLSGASFATSNPTTKDFRGFGLTVDGTNFTILPSPNATTLESLAANLQLQLRSQDGKNDLSVSVANGQLQFWSASGRAVSNPVLLTNTYELTPAGLARAINDKKLGLTAQVVNTGEAGTPYRLVVSSTTGKDQAFAISSTASAGNSLGFTSISTAADAELVVDGVAMSRSTNTVTDAITGVTLNLKSTTPAGDSPVPASLDIGLDTTSFKTKMTDLVTSFNDTSDILNQVSDPKSTLDTYGATLVGDSIVRSVRQQLRAMFQGNSSTPGTTVSAFWQMGIKIDEKGVMSFDSATFETTIQGNYTDVVKSLTGNFDNLSAYSTAPAGFAGDAVRKLGKLLDTASNGGPILSATENANTQNSRYQQDLTKLQTRMDALLVRYQKQLASMDSLVGQTNTQKTSLKSTFEGMMSVYTNN